MVIISLSYLSVKHDKDPLFSEAQVGFSKETSSETLHGEVECYTVQIQTEQQSPNPKTEGSKGHHV